MPARSPVHVLSAAQATERLAGLAPGDLVGVAVAPGLGVGLAVGDEALAVEAPPGLVHAVRGARLVWWRASTTAAPLVDAGVRPRACWDLGAVHRVLTGSRRDDPAAVWAAGHERPEPDPPGLHAPGAAPTLLDAPDLDPPAEPVDGAGHLASAWASEPWAAPVASTPDDLARAARWAALALEVQGRQAAALAELPDPRPRPGAPTLPVLTAYAESAAALLAVELAADGLPVDRPATETLLAAAVGPRPRSCAEEAAVRAERVGRVLRAFPPQTAEDVDLRNPAQVRSLLATIGIDVPDTRSWRLEPHRGTSPAVAALLEWRRSERIATTYGYAWLDRHVGPDGRLRGTWSSADAAAGRMTASAGLHNLPASLRAAVVAEPGHLLVRADLGQVEPRVLAVVSGDRALSAAAGEHDMYAPLAAALGCARPVAKVALLAAMYGQTSGTAAAALRRMQSAYPTALGFLHAAEDAGRRGEDLRTWGGRLLRFGPLPPGSPGHGRYARNAVVQGAAAELFKNWAASVRAGLGPDGSVGRLCEAGHRAQIVLCLHDELLLHVPRAAASAAVDLLRSALDDAARRWAAGTGVRFVADVAVASRWSDAKT